MALHEPFGHLQPKLCTKEGPKVKLALLITKSYESTQVERDTSLKSSQGELQVCFRLHPNWRSKQGVMNSQSPRSLNWNNFRTPPWESREKMSFGCRCCKIMQKIIYGGRCWLPPSTGRGESCESKVAHGLS
jgi:hypothetical protein